MGDEGRHKKGSLEASQHANHGLEACSLALASPGSSQRSPRQLNCQAPRTVGGGGLVGQCCLCTCLAFCALAPSPPGPVIATF